MSKMGNYILEMQEDAAHMTREQFVDKYGTSNIALWDEVTGFGWDELPIEQGEDNVGC